MTEQSLAELEPLKEQCQTLLEQIQSQQTLIAWKTQMVEFLERVAAADETQRATKEFQHLIWDENPVTNVGRGAISVDDAIEDPEFRRWLAAASTKPLPDAREHRVRVLADLHEELRTRLKQYCSRVPHLKVARAMAALFPGDFTTISYRKALRKLHSAMGLPRRSRNDPVARHADVMKRLEEALRPPGGDMSDVAERMMLPWLLYTNLMESPDDDQTASPGSIAGEERLVPLPATRRRRGLTGISGGVAALLAILEFVREGVTREELKDHFRTIAPNLRDSSINTQIYALASEFACIKLEDDRYVLTDRGAAFLETEDPTELFDWLLTRILGVDNMLYWMREEGRLPRAEVVSRLQRVNPGWTSSYAPGTLLQWLRTFGAIELDNDALRLTDLGEELASRIHWTPQELEPIATETIALDAEHVGEATGEPQPSVALPDIPKIIERVSTAGHFPKRLIAELHAGLWSNSRRHFAVLTGLSGSGKTLLARTYGIALAINQNDAGSQVCTIPVQPGWYDPGALLGYVNPLREESYVRTPFLEFLMSAAAHPAQAHTVILDEMNLSRPEQYLAPILSAMETGARIHLHQQGAVFDGVPESIRYPENLCVIGTVNMDETTHGLSDKVLDRAYTLEFWDIDIKSYPRWGERPIAAEVESRSRKLLEDLMAALRPARLHFAWRTIDDVLDFLALTASDDHPLSVEEALDSVVYAKILPKLRGDDSARVRDALGETLSVLKAHGLKASAAKVAELLKDLEVTGSARFWR